MPILLRQKEGLREDSKHIKKFSIPPAKEENLSRKSPGKKELEKILCMQTERYLGTDSVIRHNNKFYQERRYPPQAKNKKSYRRG